MSSTTDKFLIPACAHESTEGEISQESPLLQLPLNGIFVIKATVLSADGSDGTRIKLVGGGINHPFQVFNGNIPVLMNWKGFLDP